MRWIRFFPLDAGEHCYVGARFFALVEPGPRAPLAGPTEPDGPSVAESPIRIGDRATTLIDVDVWPAPEPVHASAFHLQANVMTTVLGAAETADGADWVQVEHVSGSGWVERELLRPFVRGGRWIEVDSATQTLIAWEDDVEVSRALVSTGKPGYPTPAGAFSITHKFPIRRMKASVRGEKWDYPAVPWAMRFRHGGFYLHSNYWSEEFGSAVSHGCVKHAGAVCGMAL